MKSALAVEEWFARPAEARAEIEGVLACAGHGIAWQFIGKAPAIPDAGTPWQKPLQAPAERGRQDRPVTSCCPIA